MFSCQDGSCGCCEYCIASKKVMLKDADVFIHAHILAYCGGEEKIEDCIGEIRRIIKNEQQ